MLSFRASARVTFRPLRSAACKYENGVLSISIPKKEAIEAKAKKMIAIE